MPYKTPSVVYRNLGGGKTEELLVEAGPGVAEAHSSRGVAFGDFDNDGDIDILIMNMNEPPHPLLRNDMRGANHWLKVLLGGFASSRSAISTGRWQFMADMEAGTGVLAQSSYLSVNDRRLRWLGGGQPRRRLRATAWLGEGCRCGGRSVGGY